MSVYLFDRDYSSDYLRWIKRIEQIQPKTRHLEDLQNAIIRENDPSQAYFFASEFSYKLFRMQKIILENKNVKYAFLFAQNIKNADIKSLQNVIIESKNIKYICKFACFINSSPLLENLILQSKNNKYIYYYLKNAKSILYFEKFKKVILNSKKPKYLFELAKRVNSPQDLKIIEDLMIKSGSFTYIRLLAEKIKNTNIEKLEQAMINFGNEKELQKFARRVKKSKMKNFLIVA